MDLAQIVFHPEKRKGGSLGLNEKNWK